MLATTAEIGLLSDMWEFNLWNTGVNGTIPTEFWELTNMVCAVAGRAYHAACVW